MLQKKTPSQGRRLFPVPVVVAVVAGRALLVRGHPRLPLLVVHPLDVLAALVARVLRVPERRQLLLLQEEAAVPAAVPAAAAAVEGDLARRVAAPLLVELDDGVARVVGGDERRLGQRQRLGRRLEPAPAPALLLDSLQEPVAAVQGLLILLARVLHVPVEVRTFASASR